MAFKLVQSGHQVTAVEDGMAALRVVREQPLDLLLLDIRMPGMSGLDVCREVRAAIRPGRPIALRIVAAGALGNLGAVAATGPLTELLGDPNPHVAGTAARALLRLGPAGASALREAAAGRPEAPATAHARAALAESAVGRTRHDVLGEVAL